MAYPGDLKYTKDHEWMRVSGDVAEVGITDYAQEQLGDVVFVELPDVGRKVNAGEAFGSIVSDSNAAGSLLDSAAYEKLISAS
jgi:glycine cleavage system H protein